MDKLVVVRIGRPTGHLVSWVNQGKWSTPENRNIIDNQIIRDFFVEGYNVFIVFLESGDIPVYTARVSNVRQRNNSDSLYPAANEHGPFQTFIEFTNIFRITNEISSLYDPLLNSIQFTRGHQIPIDGFLTELPIVLYKGLESVNDVYINNNYINANRTVINPHYNLY
jgi:hypothetical protein